MSRRYKGAVNERDIERYFPVRISIPIGMGLPARDWSITYSAMIDWLIKRAGRDNHAVLPSSAPGAPDAMRVLFANLEDACAFVEQFAVPIAPIGAHPKR